MTTMPFNFIVNSNLHLLLTYYTQHLLNYVNICNSKVTKPWHKLTNLMACVSRGIFKIILVV